MCCILLNVYRLSIHWDSKYHCDAFIKHALSILVRYIYRKKYTGALQTELICSSSLYFSCSVFFFRKQMLMDAVVINQDSDVYTIHNSRLFLCMCHFLLWLFLLAVECRLSTFFFPVENRSIRYKCRRCDDGFY